MILTHNTFISVDRTVLVKDPTYLVGHHFELHVAAHAEVGRAHADDGAIRDVGESLDDEPRPGHLTQPVVVAAVRPVLGAVLHQAHVHY